MDGVQETAAALVESRILIIRNQKVLLDSDLEVWYEVETKILNKAVSRNRERFPDDFMFPLTSEEVEFLRSNLEPQIKADADVDIAPMPSRNRGLPCSPAS